MRLTLAPGILVFAMLAAAGPPICDSGCIARAEDARPALKKSDFFWIQTRDEAVPAEHIPQVEGERRRQLRRGDFWTPKDLDRTFQEFDRFQGFEAVVPPGP